MTVEELNARGLRVKPLEFFDHPRWQYADGIGGDYHLQIDAKGNWRATLSDGNSVGGIDLPTAIAAANAHHAAQVAALIEVI